MADVDLDLQLQAMVGDEKNFHIIVHIDFKQEVADFHKHDVFIRPLLKELQELWHGVGALDLSQSLGSRNFTLLALLMWTIFYVPAYGLNNGLTCKGCKGCPCCGLDMDARMAKMGDLLPNKSIRGSKIVYIGIHRYLPRYHPYRHNKRYNRLQEHRGRPRLLTGKDTI